MKEIKNVLICGLGGVGCVCATKIADNNSANLKILLDEDRFERYKKNPTIFNSKEYSFDYILPKENNFKADLIIIATKDEGLKIAIQNIENFVTDTTIIISILNGIHSEKLVAEKYGEEKVLISFYIGTSCIREGRNITQKGEYNFIIGTKEEKNKENLNKLSLFLKKSQINHKVSNHIMERYWKKFMVNVGLNQICAETGLNFKEVKKDKFLVEKLKKLILEVKLIAEKEGINEPQRLYDDTIKFLIEDFEDATPSMLQDIRSGRKTEVEIFAGEVIRLGKKYNIKTPSNNEIYTRIKNIEN